MNRKGFLAFCVIGIALVFPLSSAYSYYYTIFEADFLTSGIKYEGRDEVEPLYLHKKSSPGVVPNPLPIFFFLEDNFFGPFSDLSRAIPLISPPSSILRC